MHMMWQNGLILNCSILQKLSNKTDLLRPIMEKVSAGDLTFVFAAKDTEHNNAVALKEYIESGKNTNVLQT